MNDRELMEKRLRIALSRNNWDTVRQIAVYSIRQHVVEEAFFERLYQQYGKTWEKLNEHPLLPTPIPPQNVPPPAPVIVHQQGCGSCGKRVSTSVRNHG